MKTSIVVLGSLLVVGLGILVLAGIGISSYNTQAGLQNQYDMKVKDNSSEFDNMWKQISQVVQMPEAKKDAFKEIFSSYADSRTSEGSGKILNFVREAVPNLNLDIYDKAMNIIVANRNGWTMRQKELVGIAEQYNLNLVRFPNNIFLSLFGFKKIDPKIITSTRTEKAFESGKDDDVQLFKK